MKRNSKQTKNIDTNVEIEPDYKETLNNQEQQAQNVSLINRTRSIQGKQRAISHSSAHKVRKMIVPHSIYYNHKDNLFLSPRPLTFLYLNRALPSSFHSLSPHALFSMGCKLRWPRRRARARAQPPNGIMRFELVLFRRTRLIFPIGLNCTLLFPSSFFSATFFLSPFFVSPFLFSILPLTPSAPLSLFLRLSFSLIVNATGSIKSLDRHLCIP